MLKSQFEKLRDGDFYFYLNDPYLPDNTRRQIKNTTFADVIKRNTKLTHIPHPFITDSCDFQREETSARIAPNQQLTEKVEVASGVRVYPNPANDLLNVELSNVEGASISIFSANGGLVRTRTISKQQRLNQISIRDLPAGLYVLKIITNKQMKSVAFTKL
jgi:hypothetical protein